MLYDKLNVFRKAYDLSLAVHKRSLTFPRFEQHELAARLDPVFSRDQAEKRYVQDSLSEAADTLRAWLDDGAALYVCGSLKGMAEGVDRVLRECLGDAAVQRLVEEGRYRRDVY